MATSDNTRQVDRIKQAVRFTLPHNARIIVASGGDSELLDLEGRDTWHFPQVLSGLSAGPVPWSGVEAIEQLEWLRAEGAEYLLIPADKLWWLEWYEGLARHLSDHFRVVFRDPDSCLIVALHDYLQREVRLAGVPDGLPIPPPEMIGLVIGDYNIHAYIEGGERVFHLVAATLRANGVEPESVGPVLDFGSGAGRAIRRWKDVGVELWGVDYNPYLVDWCSRAFPFASFRQNHAGKALPFADDKFGLIYSYSVFTHLDVDSQRFWMDELIRVLRPGGFLLFTVHGTMYQDVLSPEERARFDQGDAFIKEEAYSGSNSCYTLHPRSYVERELAPQLDLIDFVGGGPEVPGELALMQDAMLMTKPSG
jgi:SAM-dependent methyltransferase